MPFIPKPLIPNTPQTPDPLDPNTDMAVSQDGGDPNIEPEIR